jgi:hypothetical protein
MEGISESLNWLTVLNLLQGGLDIIELGFDSLGTSFIDLNLEKVSLVLQVLWNIRDLDVFSESLVEFFELLLELLPLSGFSELVHGVSEILSLWSFESCFPGGVVRFTPLGILQVHVFVSEIIGLILDFLDTLVVDVKAIWSFFNVLLESLSELQPVAHELLTFWGSEELLIEFFNSLDLFGGCPVFDRLIELLN